MAGIYIHIPFCRNKCIYCNFHSAAFLGNKAEFIDALCREIEIRKDYLLEPIETIYFGGGTPSILSDSDYERIFTTLEQNYDLSTVSEITIELNPEDITKEFVQKYALLPFNRASIGTQSFNSKALHYLNRNHSVEQNILAVKYIQEYWTKNISADIIYGTPNLEDDELVNSLNILIGLNVPHISCYALTVEEATALNKSILLGKKAVPTDDDIIRQMDIVINTLETAKYIQYEISNFCLEAKESIHNSNYWKQKTYIGLGPSAHSYNGHSRQWNISNNLKYINALKNNSIPFEIELLSQTDAVNEYLMTGLRTIWGIDLNYIKSAFGDIFVVNFINKSKNMIESELMIQKDSIFALTRKGMKISDRIISDLFEEK